MTSPLVELKRQIGAISCDEELEQQLVARGLDLDRLRKDFLFKYRGSKKYSCQDKTNVKKTLEDSVGTKVSKFLLSVDMICFYTDGNSSRINARKFNSENCTFEKINIGEYLLQEPLLSIELGDYFGYKILLKSM